MDRHPGHRHRAHRRPPRRRPEDRPLHRPVQMGPGAGRLRRRSQPLRREDPGGDPDDVDRRGGVAMAALYRDLFTAMWLAWLAYWWISGRRAKRTLRHESPASRLSHIGPLVLAALLFVH